MSDNKKPWKNEPTPMTDAAISYGHKDPFYGVDFVQADDARELEQRMRAAEARLASALKWWRGGYANAERELAEAHLEAAREEDGQ